MALQTRSLVLTAVGIQDHKQPRALYPEAPPIPDGIHTRWAFQRELGFPWFGFYLFRRPHEPLPVQMLGTDLFLEFVGGRSREVMLPTPEGEIQITSDQPLNLFRNDGIDLSGRSYLRMKLPEEDAAQAVELEISFRAPSRFKVTGILWGELVVQKVIEGLGGQVSRVRLAFDALTEILIEVDDGSGLAMVQDFGFTPVRKHAMGRWEPVPGFSYPMTLPMEEGVFPYPGAPMDFDQAMDVVRSRMIYTEHERWIEQFPPMYELLAALVEGGPGETSVLVELGGTESPTVLEEEERGRRMADRTMKLRAPSTPGEDAPALSDVRPLDLILLATLEPAVAQMLGLYWLDQEIDPNIRYDYLIIADYEGVLEGDFDLALHRLREEGPEWLLERPPQQLCAYVTFDRGMHPPATPLAPPSTASAYALPSNGMPILGLERAQGPCAAGLHWDNEIDLTKGRRATEAVRYHVWRRQGDSAVQTSPLAQPYECLTRGEPTLKGRREGRPKRPAGWPNLELDYIDNGLAPGAYAYRVGGIDLFGRYSQLGTDATVHLSSPKPSIPAPTGVEATALDPGDPYVLKDEAYRIWRENHPQQVGIRVRWQWTAAQQAQAPDVERFRIHFQPDHLNARPARTGAVTFKDGECLADLALPAGAPAGEYVDTILMTGADAFPITRVELGGSQVRVDCGPLYRSEGTRPITVTRGSTEVVAQGTGWKKEHVGLELRIDGEDQRYTVLDIKDLAAAKQMLLLNRPYESASGTRRTYTLVGKVPQAHAPCTIVIPETSRFDKPHPLYTDTTDGNKWAVHLGHVGYNEQVVERIPPWRAEDGYPLQGQKAQVSGLTVQLDQDQPDLKDLPYQQLRIWLGEDTTRADKTYRIQSITGRTLILTAEGGTPRVANGVSSWVIGPPLPLRQYDVILSVPSPDTDAGKAFVPSLEDPIKYAHVGVGALETGGIEGPVSAPIKVFRVRRKRPSPPQPLSQLEKEMASPADYHSRSFYTVTWRAQPHLKAHVYRALDETLFQVDWKGRKNVGANLDSVDAVCQNCFPAVDSDGSRRCEKIANELKALTDLPETLSDEEALARYRTLSDGALRVLASLPRNQRAFTRVTIQPLGGDEYEDTLDGRSTNRYFYRVAYVDGAQNESEMGVSTPPIYLPNVVPPAAPVVTRILAGVPGGQTTEENEGKITLQWASNQETDLTAYRVFRTAAKENARDVRLMEEVETPAIPAPAGDPDKRPNEVSWTDTDPPLLTTLYYRVVAVDTAGNISAPSSALSARAFKQSPPKPPTWVSAAWNADKTAIELKWKLEKPSHQVRVQRWDGGMWFLASTWLAAGIEVFSEDPGDAETAWRYRLQVRDGAGNLNVEYLEKKIQVPT